jgi:hypothetical protein
MRVLRHIPLRALRNLPPFAALLLLALPAGAAGPIRFDESWNEQRFALFSSNAYSFEGERLGVASDGTVSLVWRPVPETAWQARGASWHWSVSRSVPPTDLRQKGGDDRNLALYFVFLPEAAAREARGASIRRLLDAEEARVLVYVWGGPGGQPRLQDSPYLGPRGKTVALRPAGDGGGAVVVDLAADHASAFGAPPGALVGVAVSADSDDTATSIRAEISRLTLR